MSFDHEVGPPILRPKRRRSMNKSDVIAAMADRAGVSNKDAGGCLDAFFDVVAGEVAAGGDKVSIPGWLSFEQVTRAARMGRNPRTGESIHVPATKACKVSVGSKLKAAAKSGGSAEAEAPEEAAEAAEAAPESPSW